MTHLTRFFRRRGWRGNLVLVLPFLALFYFQLAHHVMWRDEVNPWGIASISGTLGELLHRVHYEAHPALWYVLLWTASRMTHALWMLKLVQGVIGTGIFMMLALATPYRRLEQLLIYAGFYISFEYTVMVRMYGIEVLVALVYLWFRMHRPGWIVRNVLWLCLLANVDATAAILASGLLAEYLVHLRRSHVSLAQMRRPLLLYGLSLVLCLATLWPARDIGWTTTGKPASLIADPVHFAVAFALWSGLAWFPQSLSPVSLWHDLRPWPQALLVPAAIGALFMQFRKHGREGVLYVVVLVLAIGFSMVTSVAGVRHLGMMYITFLLCLWQMRLRGGTVPVWGNVLLGLAVVANGQIIWQGHGRPLADDDDAAASIVQRNLQDLPMIGFPDAQTIGVPIRLNRPVYQMECACVDRVLTFSNRRDAFIQQHAQHRATDIPAEAVKAMRSMNVSEALLLLNEPLSRQQQTGGMQQHLDVAPEGVFDRGSLPDEHFYLYRLKR